MMHAPWTPTRRRVSNSSQQLDIAAIWSWPELFRPRRERLGGGSPTAVRQQPALALPDPADRLSPLLRAVEDALRRIARAGAAMPSNPDLGEQIGGRGRSSAARAVDGLVAQHRLVVEVRFRGRRVVFPDGLATEWGTWYQGHAPFTARKRGDPPPPPKRKANSPALPPSTPFMPAPSVAPTRCCQWPMWQDGARPTHVYCDAPTERGVSLCGAHRGDAVDATYTNPRHSEDRKRRARGRIAT